MEVQDMQNRYKNFESELSILHKQKEDLLDCVEGQVNQIEELKGEIVVIKTRSSQLESQMIQRSSVDQYPRAES